MAIAAKFSKLSFSARAVGGTFAASRTASISSLLLPSPALSEFEITLRRCENAALTTAKNSPSSELQMKDLAQSLDVTSRHAERLVLQCTGNTFGKELTLTRADVARQLLAEGQLTPEEIAVCVGYASAAAFDKAMKRYNIADVRLSAQPKEGPEALPEPEEFPDPDVIPGQLASDED